MTVYQINAQQWERVKALPAGQTTALFTTGDTLFVGGLNKIYWTLNSGASWDSSAVIFPALDYIVAIRYAQGRLYVGTVDDGVYSSADNGASWQPDNAGLAGAGALDISSLAIRGDSLYVGTYGSKVFVKKISTNSGWSAYQTGLPWFNIESLTNLNGILLAGSGGNATVSLQMAPGNSWVEVPFAAFNGDLNVFLGAVQHGNTWLAAGTQGLYRSTNQGADWTFYNPGTGILGSARFVVVGNRVIANLAKPLGNAFLQYTDDDGMSWKNFEPAPSGFAGYDIAWSSGWLYSARSNGLWRIATTTATKEPVVADDALGQNYPNPFTHSTVIPFVLTQSGPVELSVCNAMGQPLHTLWRGEKPAGMHQMELEGYDWPAGTYLYRLVTADKVVVRQMLLVK